MKRFCVSVTADGLPCYESDSRVDCNGYVKQALAKGADHLVIRRGSTVLKVFSKEV